jgi:cytochrome c
MTRARHALYALLLAAIPAACEGGRTGPAYRPYTGGHAQQGERLVREFGCGACHEIEGMRQARGELGPPLREVARRTFIAGQLPNTPENLVRWLADPPALAPATAMPNLGLSEAEARDIASYLYTLD